MWCDGYFGAVEPNTFVTFTDKNAYSPPLCMMHRESVTVSRSRSQISCIRAFRSKPSYIRATAVLHNIMSIQHPEDHFVHATCSWIVNRHQPGLGRIRCVCMLRRLSEYQENATYASCVHPKSYHCVCSWLYDFCIALLPRVGYVGTK